MKQRYKFWEAAEAAPHSELEDSLLSFWSQSGISFPKGHFCDAVLSIVQQLIRRQDWGISHFHVKKCGNHLFVKRGVEHTEQFLKENSTLKIYWSYLLDQNI